MLGVQAKLLRKGLFFCLRAASPSQALRTMQFQPIPMTCLLRDQEDRKGMLASCAGMPRAIITFCTTLAMRHPSIAVRIQMIQSNGSHPSHLFGGSLQSFHSTPTLRPGIPDLGLMELELLCEIAGSRACRMISEGC